MANLPGLQLYALLLGGFITVVTARAIVARRKRNPRRLPYPPGPQGKPFVGNRSQIPQTRAWLGYHEISKKYGDIVHLEVLGKHIVVLSSMKRVMDLLDKRAVKYSDRTVSYTMQLGGFGWSFAIMQYGQAWRDHRRAFHQHFNQTAVPKYHPIMYEETSAFLRKLRDVPSGKQWAHHLHLFFGTIIMRATYGFEDIGKNAALIDIAEGLIQRVGAVTVPGKYLVGTFPFLRHIPEWVPGAGFQREFRELKELNKEVVDTPFDDAKEKMANGQNGVYHSMARTFVEQQLDQGTSGSSNDITETMAKNVCAIAYLAGSETSIASAMALICALANNPEVQKKAQAEIDVVIGPDRLPRVEDRPALPYVNAVVKELTRWFTPAPLGLLHSNSEDDEYDGYFIPKGTIVWANIWSIMHDPEVFERSFDFIPERFLKDGKIGPAAIDPENTIFGFGRRICPGRHFADEVGFLFAASILATFDVSPPKDAQGKAIKIELVSRETGAVAVPLPFECIFAVRPGREGLLL
ncbi:hypothetical protein NMY22_g7461 [Coprinellus aureogranulatus]|nr:hypothetical protein NMY22_g7461 [Coprinellus aureogranulatus]